MNPTDRRQYLQSEAKGIERRKPIKPCPFCGNLPIEIPFWHDRGYQIRCSTCELFGPWAANEDLAVYAWNMRGGK
jgi:Lar family restriction alleviation protein